MAHETGHVVQRHMARGYLAAEPHVAGFDRRDAGRDPVGAASGAGGQAMEGAIAMSQAIALQQSINYTRSQEIEADAVGIELLAGAGFDPNEMAAFFESHVAHRRPGDGRHSGAAGGSPGHQRAHRRRTQSRREFSAGQAAARID